MKLRIPSYLGSGLLLCALLVFAKFLPAQAITFEDLARHDYQEYVYDDRTDFASSEANAIAQTPDGFIWIGSYDGLTRYDSRSFYHYGPKTGILSVSSLWVDNQALLNHKLWIGTNDHGLACYAQGQFTYYDREKGLPANTIRDLAQDRHGNLYVATTSGIGVILKDGSIKTITDRRVSNQYISNLITTRYGQVAGLTKHGSFFILDDQQSVKYLNPRAFTFGSVISAAEDVQHSGCFYFGTTDDTVAEMDLNGSEPVLKKIWHSQGLSRINTLISLEDGRVLAAADKGFGYFDADGSFHGFPNLKLNNNLCGLMLDYEHNLWLISKHQGLSKLTTSTFNNILAETGQGSPVTNAVLRYHDRLYIATDNGLIILKDKRPVENSLTRSLKGLRLRHLLADSQGRLWISTYSSQGLVQSDGEQVQKTYTQENGLPSNMVRQTMEAKNGTLLVGTVNGLSFLKSGQVVNTLRLQSNDKRKGLTNGEILSLCQLRNGQILVGTDGGGINVLNGEEITDTLDEEDGLKSNVIMRIKEDPQKDLVWILTGNSLAVLKGGKIINLDKFPYTNNYDLLFAPDNKIFILSSHGLILCDQEQLLTKGSVSLVLNYRQGMSGSITANSFSCQDTDGSVYLCLHNGVNMLNLKNSSPVFANFRMAIPAVQADGQEYYVKNDRVEIPSSTTKLTINGCVLVNSLSDPLVSCYLEGLDKKPEVKHNSQLTPLTYTNLSGGDYKYHIQILDPMLGVATKEKVITIHKDLKIWEYTGVRILLLLLFIGGMFYWNHFSLKRRTQALLAKQKSLRRFLDEIIRSFAKAIDLKDPYTRGHSARVALYAREIAQSMGYTTEEANKLYRIGMLHDVGKVIIPETILNKKGRLTDTEYGIMKKHTTAGSIILEEITSFPDIAIGAKDHHERMDGHGYPKGLTAPEIPLNARIIAVADTFDAMNSTRSYRHTMPREKIISELEKAKGTQLDPQVTEILLQLIRSGKVKIKAEEEAKTQEK